MKNFIWYIIIILLVSCEKQSNRDIQTENKNMLIVDGIIGSYPAKYEIKLSRSSETLNQQPVAVTGAEVIISSSDGVHVLNESPAKQGSYFTDSLFFARPGPEYTLYIFIGEDVYSAKTSMVAGYQLKPLAYSSGGNNFFQIIRPVNSFSSSYACMFKVNLNWSHLAYCQGNTGECEAELMFYSLPFVDVGEIFPPQSQQVFFPAGTIIKQSYYCLNTDHAAYIRALLLETTMNGGLFDVSRANLPTNLSNGAAGYFAACYIVNFPEQIAN